MHQQEWYYAEGTQSVGPLSSRQLQELARRGTITRSTLVTTLGSKSWIPAEKVDSLFPKPTPAIPLPPPPPGAAILPVLPVDTVTQPFARLEATGRKSVVVLSVLAASAASLAVVFGVILFLRQGDPPAPSAGKTVADTTPPEVALDSPKRQNEETEEETQKLRKEKKQVQQELEDLGREKDKLSRDLKDLGARLEHARKWRQVRFALVNPAHFAVGVDVTPDDQFRVICKAEESDAEAALRIAGKAGIPRIANDPALTRRVYSASQVGDVLGGDLSKEIHQFWKAHRYIEKYGPDDVATMVTFVDLSTGGRRLGFYIGETNEELEFQSLLGRPERIRRELIQPGTAKKAPGDSILGHVSEMEFLDYCVLSVAQKVASPPGVKTHVDIAIRLKFDVLEEIMTKSKTPDTEKITFWAGLFTRLTKRDFISDPRKGPVRQLREAAMALENEMYVKCTQIGLPVVEREKEVLDMVQEERRHATEAGFEKHEYAHLACATHMILLEPALSKVGAEYALNVRLISVDTGRVIWAMQGDRRENGGDIRKPVSQYLLQSGRMAVVTFNGKAQPPEFRSIEEPAVMQPCKFKGNTTGRSHVVLVEDDRNDQLAYRPLFGKQIFKIPKSVIANINFTPRMDDILRTHPDQMRCVVWRVAKGLLPPAGRIQRSKDGLVTAALGRSAGVTPHTKFRVLRPGGQAPATGDRLLPMEFAVVQVQDAESQLVAITETALTGPADHEDQSVADGDIAIVQNNMLRSVRFDPPRLTEPRPQVRRQLLSNQNTELRFAQKTQQAGVQLQERLTSALRQLGIPVEQGDSPPPVRTVRRGRGTSSFAGDLTGRPTSKGQATHVMSGTITLLSESAFHVDLDIKEAANNTLLDHVEFDVPEAHLAQ